jgi:hypothetical protein
MSLAGSMSCESWQGRVFGGLLKGAARLVRAGPHHAPKGLGGCFL